MKANKAKTNFEIGADKIERSVGLNEEINQIKEQIA
jgi:hypothetical protein